MRTFVCVCLGAPFLAGFIAGEGHFFISPNNAGQSWSCGFQLSQRDDNADLLAAARDVAGCGQIRWVPAQGTSHPQVAWLVQSIDGCVRLASFLADLHLLGKKAGDLAVWRRAVAAWKDADAGRARWERLRASAEELRAHRDAAFAPDYARVDITSADLADFLAGFASAEGHFGASSTGHPRFTIKLRADDSAVLALLRTSFGVGRLVDVPQSRHGRAQTAWLVTRLGEQRSLTLLFDRHPPLGRTGRTYRHWRELVLARHRRADTLRPLAERVRRSRRYRPPADLKLTRSPRETRLERYREALESWARDTGPPFTATFYGRWRRNSGTPAPNRDTVARFFGSWRAALLAAGLSTEGSRSAETIARTLDTAARTRAPIAWRRRLAVQQAVHRCWADLGRVPDASEFFRWRLRNAPESPSQPIIYRLFPGGWPEVLDTLPAPAASVSR